MTSGRLYRSSASNLSTSVPRHLRSRPTFPPGNEAYQCRRPATRPDKRSYRQRLQRPQNSLYSCRVGGILDSSFSPSIRQSCNLLGCYLRCGFCLGCLLGCPPSISPALYAGIFLYVHSAGLYPACRRSFCRMSSGVSLSFPHPLPLSFFFAVYLQFPLFICIFCIFLYFSTFLFAHIKK